MNHGDLEIAKYIMMASLGFSASNIVILLLWWHKSSAITRKKRIELSFQNFVWIVHVFLFYVYTLSIKYYWDPIPENDIWFYAWGSIIVFHGVVNTMLVSIVKIITWFEDGN